MSLDIPPTEDGVQRELTIKEEYQLWRKNCRYMYEFVSETALTWPSLTIQWLPEHHEQDGVIDAKLLLGTHTSGEDTNYLKVASTQVPSALPHPTNKANSRIKITKKLENAFEINRARYMPQDSSVVATINGEGQIDLYNIKEDSTKAYSHLEPHTANGYGLAWSSFTKGHLLTSSDDQTVVNTDVASGKTVFSSSTHQDIVNDAKWHVLDANLFGSVSDDNYTFIYDARTPQTPILKHYNEESKGINSIAFSPFSHNLVAVGNANSNICLLDLRRLVNKDKSSEGLLHTMMGHSDSITCLEFSPHKDGIIASGSQDRRLIIWDLFKIGEEQQQEDAEDGCPELFMMHAGHTGAVSDLSWCPYKEWTLGSVADDNIVHLWEVGKSLIDADKQLEIADTDLE
ncbi:histone acetyltransferase subunit [Suhomyces tanzawaensis NRRL Y-17324]|uniref:Histone acetyltransferase subunit n=1 Tax=Suhomyces tanzawaensis NRRL Y-17324 TaxID=984487 RepID=A0A1E4SCH7_9ASCO|nr:histone acetyltransferase subunit [Suhomyces tanzawaensis NRRL Y-17324]ODV77168.1 histone acetyltransferase subunit [Suhomyces tanzawaensis NRRL Y-17324]